MKRRRTSFGGLGSTAEEHSKRAMVIAGQIRDLTRKSSPHSHYNVRNESCIEQRNRLVQAEGLYGELLAHNPDKAEKQDLGADLITLRSHFDRYCKHPRLSRHAVSSTAAVATAPAGVIHSGSYTPSTLRKHIKAQGYGGAQLDAIMLRYLQREEFHNEINIRFEVPLPPIERRSFIDEPREERRETTTVYERKGLLEIDGARRRRRR